MKRRLEKLISHLQQGLIERDEPTRLALLASLAGEHMLFLGPPGTAKSELARRLKLAFSEGSYFERLLTKFSVPEELFGPLSIKALEQDRYERLTHCYLPSASIAFIDEIFKANSAILNSLLTLLNEREFDNGNRRVKTPLIAVIGASNELPESDELDALYDRFLIRYQVDPVSEQGFANLLNLPEQNVSEIPSSLQLSLEDIAAIQEQASLLPLTEEVQFLLKQLHVYLQEQALYVSDRRWRKFIKLLKVSAYTNGQQQVDIWDCWLIQHSLWQHPSQRSKIFDWYQSQLGTDTVINPHRLGRLADTWQATLEEERQKTRHKQNEFGESLYIDGDGEVTTLSGHSHQAESHGELLYLAPPDQNDRSNQGKGYTKNELKNRFFDDHYQQCHIEGHWVNLEQYIAVEENQLLHLEEYQPLTEPVQYTDPHIQSRVDETQSLLNAIDEYCSQTTRRINGLEEDVNQHLWLARGFAKPARQNLQRSFNLVVELADRISAIQAGFSALPRISAAN